MKHFNFWAFAMTATMMAACANEDDLTIQSPPVEDETTEVPILFTSSSNNFTRADIVGAEAAEKLGKKFVVTGFKGSKTADVGSIVFDNYLVEYAENTAHTTESNSKNWEYVGKGLIPHAVTNGITQQAIKYWDFTQTQYDFFAWSTGSGVDPVYNESEVAPGKVYVTNIIPNSKDANWTTGSPTRPAYSLTGSAEDLSKCYISDLVTVNKSSDTPGYGEVAGYKDAAGNAQTVTLKFRQLGTKVRIALYETIPGYSVKDVKFYTKGGVLDAATTGSETVSGTPAAGQIVDEATIFAANADIYTQGTYTVYFPTVDTPDNIDNNQAHIKYTGTGSGDTKTTVELGTLNYIYRESGEKDNGAKYLGRASNEASYAGDPANNYYKFYLPNENGTNLNLRVDFTLESIDGTGETIVVKNAKAQVPSIYTTWKPGYAYTYLFKISDNTNGRTGVYDPTQGDNATINSDPAGLYPITFDAVAVNAEEDGHTQETITTIATPSITTYQNGSTVVNNDEYTIITPDAAKKINGHIYVTVNDNDSPGSLITLDANPDADNGVALYSIPANMTEEDVVDALTYQDVDDNSDPTHTIKGRNGKVLTKATKVDLASEIDAANKWMLTNSVEYGADGNAISVGTNQAMRFQPAASTTYAFVYTKTAATGATDKNKDLFEAIAADKLATSGKRYRYAYKNTEKSHTIVNDKGTPETTDDESTDYYDAQKGHVYFERTGTDPNYTYSKVDKPFIGQGATNLFTRSGAAEPYTYTKATTPYAQSGVTYYYTTDGQHYKEAHLVTYASDMLPGGLYEYSAGSYTATTDTTPVDGKAYYYGTEHVYCVFLPQNVKDMWEIDKDAAKVETTETPINGQTYFDKYHVNDAVRYVKVIKVQ